MKKSKLIELLNKIDGNPEIKLWNGYVGDWVDISPEIFSTYLVKQPFDRWLESCRLEECVIRKDWDFKFSDEEITRMKAMYKTNVKWEYSYYVTEEDIAKGRYKRKPIKIINAKIKGESTYDRLGNISY